MVPLWLNAWSAPPGLDKAFIRNARITPALRPLKQDVVGDISGALWVVMGTIGIVLLIACANVANLLLVRAEGRQQETAVRAALGAGRWRLLREWLIESLALTSLSGVLGIGLAIAILRLLVAIGPGLAAAPRRDRRRPGRAPVRRGGLHPVGPVVRRDPRAPACRTECDAGARRIQPDVDPQPRSAPGAADARGRAGRAGARAADRFRADDSQLPRPARGRPGLHRRGSSSTGAHRDPRDRRSRTRSACFACRLAIRDAVAAIPGVSSAAFTSSAPMEPFNGNDVLFVEGQVYREGELPPIRRFKFVSPGFFQTVGIRLLAGRDLTWIDLSQHRRGRRRLGEPGAGTLAGSGRSARKAHPREHHRPVARNRRRRRRRARRWPA